MGGGGPLFCGSNLQFLTKLQIGGQGWAPAWDVVGQVAERKIFTCSCGDWWGVGCLRIWLAVLVAPPLMVAV